MNHEKIAIVGSGIGTGRTAQLIKLINENRKADILHEIGGKAESDEEDVTIISIDSGTLQAHEMEELIKNYRINRKSNFILDTPPEICAVSDYKAYDPYNIPTNKNRTRMYAVDSLSKQRKKTKAARKANKARRKK